MVPSKRSNVRTQSTLDRVVVFCLLRKESPNRINDEGEQMTYERHMDGLLVFHVCDIKFCPRDLRLLPTYIVAFFILNCVLLRSRQSLSYSTILPNCMESEGLFPSSQETYTDPFPEHSHVI
jgi:hypothetical protein